MTRLFKDLIMAYCREVKKYNDRPDHSTLCGHLCIDDQTRAYLIEGAKRLHRKCESAECKIIIRLLLPTIEYEDLMDIFSQESEPVDEESFREFLEPHDESDELEVSNANNYEPPIPF